MERFAVANPSRASLAGIEMPPRGHRVEVRLCYPPILDLYFQMMEYILYDTTPKLAALTSFKYSIYKSNIPK